jgi:hypothetical protein
MPKRATQVDFNAAAPDDARASAPDETEVAELAYRLWLERGCPVGSDQEDWFQAESTLRSRNESAANELAHSA